MKKLKVVHYTTQCEDCGIAKYQQQFVDAMEGNDIVENVYFPFSPNVIKAMSPQEFSDLLEKLAGYLKDADILHIQHEISFFGQGQLDAVITLAKSHGIKVLVTVHTAPEAQYQPEGLRGLGLRSLLHYYRKSKSDNRFLETFFIPLRKADEVIVHNDVTKQSLMRQGIDETKMRKICIPVPNYDKNAPKSRLIRNKLDYQSGDIIYATVGFISEAKGMLDAVKALSFLPPNYKLAIIGGMHPTAVNTEFLNVLCDWIVKLDLQDRAYITGFIEEDMILNALIRECDVCVYPFNQKYYSYVSSASLNNAISNHKPIIAYPTKPFIELNKEKPVLTLCRSFNYYEIARYLTAIDLQKAAEHSKSYAQTYAYSNQANQMIDIYQALNTAS